MRRQFGCFLVIYILALRISFVRVGLKFVVDFVRRLCLIVYSAIFLSSGDDYEPAPVLGVHIFWPVSE